MIEFLSFRDIIKNKIKFFFIFFIQFTEFSEASTSDNFVSKVKEDIEQFPFIRKMIVL